MAVREPIEVAEREVPLHRVTDVNRARIDAAARDVLIAGAAAQHGATAVSKNSDDFETLGVPSKSYLIAGSGTR